MLEKRIVGIHSLATIGILGLFASLLSTQRVASIIFWLTFGFAWALISATMCMNPPQATNLERPWPSSGSKFIIYACIFQTTVLTIRLLCSPHFGGSFFDMDYGTMPFSNPPNHPNVVFDNGDSDEVVGSMLHFLQGFAVLFLFPKCACSCFGELTKNAFDMLAAFAVFSYPVYNIMMRVVEHVDYFATSSWCNNGMEHSLGFIVGSSIGCLVTIFGDTGIDETLADTPFTDVPMSFMAGTPSDSIFGADRNAPPMFFPGQGGVWTESKSSGAAIKVRQAAENIKLVGGALLFSASVLSIVRVITSWNNLDLITA